MEFMKQLEMLILFSIGTFSTNFDFGAKLWHQIFLNFKSKFQPCNLQLITFLKRYFASKSTKNWLRYREKKIEKHVFLPKIEFKKKLLEKHDLFEFSHIFQPSFADNSAICWSVSQWEIGWQKVQEVILPDFVFSFFIR
jgi:hypothetical protein